MITESDVDRLLAVRTAQRDVLSLYLRVPADPAELRELGARAHGMLTLAAGNGGAPDGLGGSGWDPPQVTHTLARDEQQARELIEAHGRDWLGHTAAIFVAEQAGVSEAFKLPCQLPDRAVLAGRPHIRPLLVARQRCPVHYVAVAGRADGWLFEVAGDEVAELGHDHPDSLVPMLERAVGVSPGPIVVGGHAESIGRLTGMLPAPLRQRLAGTFVIDPHAMTPAKVRDLAGPVIAGWVGMHEQRRIMEMREGEGPYDPLTVTGLRRCLDAVNEHAVDLLVVPVGGITGGYVCESCGTLGGAVTGCPDGPAESRWVPDLFEEMVTKTIADGGRTEALTEPPGDVAAHLRFPVLQSAGR